MLSRLNIAAKFMIAMSLAIVVVVVGLSVSNLRTMDNVIFQAERAELDGHVSAISNSIAKESRLAEALSTVVASIPLVQERFAEGDRAFLSDQFVPVFKVISDHFGARQFQFHTPPATSFLRLHKPQKFGDDLSSFRHTVTNTNATQKSTLGLEVGVAGLGVRGVVPVFNKGAHIGSVEFGMSFGQQFFDDFKARNGIDAGLYILRDGEFKTFGSTMGDKPVTDKAVLLKALEGEPQLQYATLNGIPTTFYSNTVKDYSGKPIGVLEVAMDRTKYISLLTEARNSAIVIGLIALGAGLVLAVFTARHFSKRIYSVMQGVNQVATGDLAEAIQSNGADEIGSLADAAEKMRTQLHSIVTDVKQQSKGVNEAAQEISKAVRGQAAASSQMSASVTEITSTMEEFSASSNQIADHSKMVVDVANETLASSKDGSQAMANLNRKMIEIQEENQESLKEIFELGNKSKEISKVMEIINSVADQTKLIAFNAALEAASAGESGRRFSVVAAEIRRLADSVTDSTSEIEANISQIQDSISRLVITSENGAVGIEDGMHATSDTAKRLSMLVEAAERTSNTAQQISLSTQQQKTASEQVVIALREIVTASNHTAESIERVSDISRDMTQRSAQLDTIVDRFKLSKQAATTPIAIDDIEQDS
ncbi:MAG: methyl-accepting chemotaxis protein [Methylocystaceae bacterium]|nr:methyl-accepting chemotaxis protein [Methylocystaceae bacterium]